MDNQRLTQFIDSAKKKLAERGLHRFRDLSEVLKRYYIDEPESDHDFPIFKEVGDLKEE